MLVGLNFNYNGQTFASMKLNAKIAGSLHLLSDLAFRSVEIPDLNEIGLGVLASEIVWDAVLSILDAE